MNNWKEKFKILEQQEEWYYDGIDLMEEVIEKNPDDRDAYLNICYCIVNAIIYKPTVDDYCDNIFNHYLEISYKKFKNDPEYLYFMAEIISYTDWIVKNINIDFNEMFKKAYEIDPDNIIFKCERIRNESHNLCKTDFKNGKFEEISKENLEKLEKLEYEKKKNCLLIEKDFENIKKKLQLIGKIGDLEIKTLNFFCNWRLIKN